MREASGELNMTVITIIAVVAVGVLFAVFIWPMIQRQIADQSCKTYGTDYSAFEVANSATAQGGNVKTSKWKCCKTGEADCKAMATN